MEYFFSCCSNILLASKEIYASVRRFSKNHLPNFNEYEYGYHSASVSQESGDESDDEEEMVKFGFSTKFAGNKTRTTTQPKSATGQEVAMENRMRMKNVYRKSKISRKRHGRR